MAAALAAALASAGAAEPPGAAAATGLDGRIEELEGEALRLQRDLLVLEEELLYPAGTQVALFVSMDTGGKPFALESVQVKLDGKVVANHLYTPLEVQALQRGAVQRLYLGNLRGGEHELAAAFAGKGGEHKRAATLKFEKGNAPKYIELQIKDPAGRLQPEFELKVWQ